MKIMKKIFLTIIAGILFISCSNTPILISSGTIAQISYKVYKDSEDENKYEVVLNGYGKIPDMEYNDTLLQMNKLPFIKFLESKSKLDKGSVWITVGDSITYIGEKSLVSDLLYVGVHLGKSVADIGEGAIDKSSFVFLQNEATLKTYQNGIYNSDYTKLYHLNYLNSDTIKLKNTIREMYPGVLWYNCRKYNVSYTQIGDKTFRNDISGTGRYYLLVDSSFLTRYTIKDNHIRKNSDYGSIPISETLEEALFEIDNGGRLYQVKAIKPVHSEDIGVYADGVELVYELFNFN